MEYAGRRIERQPVIRLNARIYPALAALIFHYKHVVCEPFAKAKVRLVLRLCLWRSCKLYIDFHVKNPLQDN